MRSGGALLALALLLVGSALAHVPVVSPTDRIIEESDRSWAFYDEAAPGAEHVWSFALDAGDPLLIQVAVPVDASWTPEATLRGPEGEVPLERVDRVTLEPFAPYASREVWSLKADAPASGTYELVVGGEGGRYALGYGLQESFTLREWITVPIEVARVHAWEGRPLWWPLVPYVLGLSAVVALIVMGAARPPLLARFAAGMFLGSALDRLIQVGIALASGAQASAGTWALALLLLAPALALSWGAWRARRPVTLLVLALGGLVAWAGFLLGPALSLAAAAERAWARWKGRATD